MEPSSLAFPGVRLLVAYVLVGIVVGALTAGCVRYQMSGSDKPGARRTGGTPRTAPQGLQGWGETATSVLRAPDGRVVVVGRTGPPSSLHFDGLAAVLDANGKTLRIKVVGIEDSLTFNSVAATDDGGFMVVGTRRSSDDRVGRGWAGRFDSELQILWTRDYGVKDGTFVSATCGAGTGVFLLAGGKKTPRNYVDVWIAMVDSGAGILWEKLLSGKEWKGLGASDWDGAREVRQTGDGGFVVLGQSTTSHGGPHVDPTLDAWLIKLDGRGAVEWDRTYDYLRTTGLPPGIYVVDHPTAVAEIPDGGYAVASLANGEEGWLFVVDSRGVVHSSRTFTSEASLMISDLVVTSDGGFLLAGHITEKDSTGKSSTDAWIVKLDAGMETVWEKTFGGPFNDEATALCRADVGGYVVSGSIGIGDGTKWGTTDLWVFRLDKDGEVVWDRRIDSISSGSRERLTANGLEGAGVERLSVTCSR